MGPHIRFSGAGGAPAITAVCVMAAGDGMADIVGRKFGSVKWPWDKEKSLIGSAAFVAGTPVYSSPSLLLSSLELSDTKIYEP